MCGGDAGEKVVVKEFVQWEGVTSGVEYGVCDCGGEDGWGCDGCRDGG